MPKLKLFGHPIESDDSALELRETSIEASPRVLRKLAKHLLWVADMMETKKWAHQDHWHWQPRMHQPGKPEIVICRRREDDES